MTDAERQPTLTESYSAGVLAQRAWKKVESLEKVVIALRAESARQRKEIASLKEWRVEIEQARASYKESKKETT